MARDLQLVFEGYTAEHRSDYVGQLYRPFRCESRLVQKSINTPIFRALLEGKGLPKVALLPKKHSDSRLDS